MTPIAASARRAGYKIFSVDFFGDVDLRSLCEESLSIITQKRGETCGIFEQDYNVKHLLRLSNELIKRNDVDGIILGSGLEDFAATLREIEHRAPIIGNSPELIIGVRDKAQFFQALRQLKVPHPQTVVVYDFEEAKRMAKEIGYPIVLKPSKGFGGFKIIRVETDTGLEEALQSFHFVNKGVLIQKYVCGIPASVSTISTPERAVAISVNEQLLGVKWLGVKSPFSYCGNIVPLNSSSVILESCKALAEKVISHFRLVGSNGVDFVISREGTPFVIEVNPRLQGTLECIERVFGINLVEAHVKACIEQKLPKNIPRPNRFCIRLILYSPRRAVVPDLKGFYGVRDIPLDGVVVEEGEPLCSITLCDATREDALSRGKLLAKSISSSLIPYGPE